MKSLGVAADWQSLRSIRDIRNDIEHYYPDLSQDTIRSVLSSAFRIIRQFAVHELKEDPLKLLGQETWTAMLEMSEVFEAERSECEAALGAVNWGSDILSEGITQIRCVACGSNLLKPDTEPPTDSTPTLKCRSCGLDVAPDTYIPDAIASALAGEMYLAEKDGAEIPYTVCPNCWSQAYVVSEDRCAVCGESFDRECSRCSNPIPAEELGSWPYCSWCAHMIAKDD